MRVYRFQAEDGSGPFQSTELIEAMDAAMVTTGRMGPAETPWHDRLPMPWADGIDAAELVGFEIPRTGCASLRQLVTWFPRPCRAVLAAHGQRLVAFEVPHRAVLIGRSQLVFDGGEAVAIEVGR
jgi:hypothetical protein